MTAPLLRADLWHECAGCPVRIAPEWLACSQCEARLPADLQQALKQGRRVRHRDHRPFLDALAAARAWWATNRQDQP